jgi:hypothetical protein
MRIAARMSTIGDVGYRGGSDHRGTAKVASATAAHVVDGRGGGGTCVHVLQPR